MISSGAGRVRHEAGEALGAIGTPECLQLLEQYQSDPCLEVAQTCQLALQRIQYYSRISSPAAYYSQLPQTTGKAVTDCTSQHCSTSCVQDNSDNSTAAESASPYLSIDPAPAAPACKPTAQLRATLLDKHAPIFERYRALFALRNKVCPPGDCLLPSGATCKIVASWERPCAAASAGSRLPVQRGPTPALENALAFLQQCSNPEFVSAGGSRSCQRAGRLHEERECSAEA